MRMPKRLNESTPTKPTMLSVPEAAQLLGVASVTVRLWLSKGKLPYYKLGDRTLLKEADVIAFLESRRVPARAVAGAR